MKNSGSYLDEQLSAAYKFYVRFRSRCYGAEATAFSCHAVKNEETETEEREGRRRRRRDDRERERRRKDIARQAEEERVEEDDVGPDATRHRRIKSTLHRDITIVFVTAAELRGARSAGYRDEQRSPPPLVNSGAASFYRVPPSSSVRLDNVRRGDKVSHFRWESRHFLSP